MAITVVNILVLLCSFTTLNKHDFGGIYNTIFIALILIYFLVLLCKLGVKGIRMIVGRSRASLILIFLVLFVLRY